MTKPLYFWNGSSFELVGPTTPQSPFAYQTSAPTAPATGDIWIDSDGDVDTYNRQLTRYYFVASAGQTSVSGTDANGLTLAYVAGSEAVYVNGALQVRGVDYTATNGTSITNLSALALNDVVEVFAYTAFTVANAYTKTETDSVAAAAAGLRMIVPTSISVGSGSGSVNSNGTITFSGASSVSVNGVFSATYETYLLTVNLTDNSNNDGDMLLRWRNAGTDSTASYYSSYTGINTLASPGVINKTQDPSTNGHAIGKYDNSTKNSQYVTIDVTNVFLSNFTTNVFKGFGSTDASNLFSYNGGGNHRVSQSYDGFTLAAENGNFTGTVRVYGYKA